MSAHHLAASNIAWDSSDDERVAAMLAAGGLSGVEIAPTKWRTDVFVLPPAAAETYRAWWEDRGLRIVALQSLLYGRPELQLFRESTRQALGDHLKNCIGLASHLGAQVLVFGSPSARVRGSLSFDEAVDVAAVFFRDIADRAAAVGVTLCIEPNPPEYGCDFVNTLGEAAVLSDAVSSAGFGVHADVGAMTLAGEDYLAALRNAAPHLRHVHASEPDLAEIGTRGVDHPRVKDALVAINYNGCVSIEMRPGGMDALTRAIQVTKAAYGGVDQ